MTTKTVIRLTKLDGTQHDIKLNYDDATTQVIAEAAIQLIHRHRLNDGEGVAVITADVEE
jgi:hypothetical protein